ncbi:MAG: hypothetical protein ACRCZJ_01195 [Erysipelotrichaceae bacterium]
MGEFIYFFIIFWILLGFQMMLVLGQIRISYFYSRLKLRSTTKHTVALDLILQDYIKDLQAAQASNNARKTRKILKRLEWIQTLVAYNLKYRDQEFIEEEVEMDAMHIEDLALVEDEVSRLSANETHAISLDALYDHIQVLANEATTSAAIAHTLDALLEKLSLFRIVPENGARFDPVSMEVRERLVHDDVEKDNEIYHVLAIGLGDKRSGLIVRKAKVCVYEKRVLGQGV